MTRDLKLWPITNAEKLAALKAAIAHYRKADRKIANALDAVLDDINHEQKLNDMRLHAGEGPSE